MWHELVGVWAYASGSTGGTITIPKGATLIHIVIVTSGASTLTIFGGSSIPLATGTTDLRFNHTLVQSQNDSVTSGSQDVVIGANCTSYFIEYVTPNYHSSVA